MYVLDTNVISELRKDRNADRNVAAWAETCRLGDLHISVMTLLELEYGMLVARGRNTDLASVLGRWITKIHERFLNRVLPVDETVARKAAAMHVPKKRSERDALIAATALSHNMIVVTRNVRDFADTGVKLLNPWESRV